MTIIQRRTIVIKRGTAAEWAAHDDILLDGELGVLLQDGPDILKVGDDSTPFSQLPTFAGGTGSSGFTDAQVAAIAASTATYSWTGAPHASSSVQKVAGAITRTNLATDPEARSAGVQAGRLGWASRWFGNGSNGVDSLVTGATDGPFPWVSTYWRKTWTSVNAVQDVGWTHTAGGTSAYPVTPGQQVTMSSYVRGSRSQPSRDGQNGMFLQFVDSAGAQVSNTFGTSSGPITAGTWVRYSHTATVPAGAAYLIAWTQVYISSTTWQAGDILEASALLVESSASLRDYFAGSTPAGLLVVGQKGDTGRDGAPGAKGDPGTPGANGATGATGAPGTTPNISATATALTAGAAPTVTRSGADATPSFAFGIPAGATGATGAKGDGGDMAPYAASGSVSGTFALSEATVTRTRRVSLVGNATFTLPTPSAGISFTYTLVLVQDATGGRTVTWPTAVKWHKGTKPTLSTAANAIDLVHLFWTGAEWIGLTGAQAIA